MLDLSPALRLSSFVRSRALAANTDHPAALPLARVEPEIPPMPEPVLRPWRPSDLEPCMAIWRAASEVGHPFLSAEDLDADAVLVRTLYMPSTDITVAEMGGVVVGFIALSGNFVGGLFVAPTRHRQGIGARLLAHAAARHPVLEVEVYLANRSARRFYAAAGFAEVLCQRFDDRGRALPLVRMRARKADGRPPVAGAAA
jgi:GNAT superfamily N-acetyltransferase